MRDGQEEQDRFLRALRQSRAAAFRKETVPYFRYVMQSGFGLLMSALLFAAFIWYVDLIKHVPADWPADMAGIAVLSLASIPAPLRTYFRPADPVFLLPLEKRLFHAYLEPALRNSIASGVLRAIVVFAIFAPIYTRAPVTQTIAPTHPVLLLSLLFGLLGGFTAYAGWRERKPASRVWRLCLKSVRWLLTIGITAALLLKPLVLAIPFMLLSMGFLWFFWRLPIQHFVPWEKLIHEEEATHRRWMSFLSWFVDVPAETAGSARRMWLSWIADIFLWRHERAWHFLYAKTFIRSETFGAFGRWVIVIGIIMAVTDGTLANLIAYAVGLIVGGLQLSELRRVRFVETAHTLPIAPEGRYIAAASIARTAGAAAAILLGLAGMLTAGGNQMGIWFAALAIGLIWCGWLVPRRIAKHSEEDDF